MKRGGSYIVSPDLIKKSKKAINPVNNYDKWFLWAVRGFIDECNWKDINYLSNQEKMNGKSSRKITQKLLLMCCMLKKRIIFQ